MTGWFASFISFEWVKIVFFKIDLKTFYLGGLSIKKTAYIKISKGYI